MASLQAYQSHGIRYYRIVESFRKDGKPSIRVLAHLGRVDDILQRHQQHSKVPVKISSVSAGAVTAVHRLAEELGKRMVLNVVMVGFLCAISQVVSLESCRQSVNDSVPARFRDLNLNAFDEGYAYGLKLLESGPVTEETDADGEEELESAN